MQQNPCLGGFSNLEGGNETRVFAIYDELECCKTQTGHEILRREWLTRTFWFPRLRLKR